MRIGRTGGAYIVVARLDCGEPIQFVNASKTFLFLLPIRGLSYGKLENSAIAGRTHVVKIAKAVYTSFRPVFLAPHSFLQPVSLAKLTVATRICELLRNHSHKRPCTRDNSFTFIIDLEERFCFT